MQYYEYTFIFIESELLCLLLRWPYGQSTIGSQYNKTAYISWVPKYPDLDKVGGDGDGGRLKGWKRGGFYIQYYIIQILEVISMDNDSFFCEFLPPWKCYL